MTTANEQTAEAFAALLLKHRQAPNQHRLTNVSLFCGAGFSKSWDSAYPTGAELFGGTVAWKFHLLPTVCRTLNIDEDNLDLGAVKDLVYALDMYRKYPELRPRYVDDQLIEATRSELVHWVQANLENKVKKIGYWSKWENRFPLPKKLSPPQRASLDLFRRMWDMGDGSTGKATGIRTHFLTTNYDFVIETMLNALLSDEDSLFLYAYRGVTPTRLCNVNHVGVAHDHWLAFNLLKLNGGLEIRPDGSRYCLNYARWSGTSAPSGCPKLVLPSREQDYTDSYFVELFRKAVRLLRDTHILVIVGYSLPKEDALLRFLLRQFAESIEDAVGKSVFYVDPNPAVGELATIFGARTHVSGLSVATFSGTWGDFAQEVVAQLPAH